MNGIALKVTYNDGGSAGHLFGFNGVCSDQNILVNVRHREMTNCADARHPCRAFADNNFAGRRPPSGRCYESELFRDTRLKFGCGLFHGGPKDGAPIPVSNVGKGDIAFLTTLLPQHHQHERIIFGCFRVAGTPRLRAGQGYMIMSDGTMDVRLPDDIALQMNFWRYFKNRDGSRVWGAGLFRYVSETGTSAALHDLVALLGNHAERDVLLKALAPTVERRPVRRLPIIEAHDVDGGGFGGGESEAHRTLNLDFAHAEARAGIDVIGCEPSG